MRTCKSCGENKEFSEFRYRNKAAGRQHQRCKACMAIYGQAHYAANKALYKARSKANSRTRRESLKARIWSYLVEHPCVDCGQSNPLVLEFDHVDPTSKLRELYWMVQETYGWSAIAAEILKCEVRCANCHRRRTAAQFAWPKLAFAAGSASNAHALADGEVRRRPPRAGPPRIRVAHSARLTMAMMTAGLRVCYVCGLTKPLEQFHFRDKAQQKRHSTCGECFSAYRREHYRMNRSDYIQRNTRLLHRRGRAWQRRLCEYLLVHPCVDCTERDPIVLEFDHLERASKRASVAFLARRGYPWSTVMNEVAKCEVRCANCHRRRTAEQFEWPKLRMAAGLEN